MVAKVSGRRCPHSDVLAIALGSFLLLCFKHTLFLAHGCCSECGGRARLGGTQEAGKLNPAEDAGVPFLPRKIFKLSSLKYSILKLSDDCSIHGIFTYLHTG